MQNLLRRSPSGPILCTAGSSPFIKAKSFLSLSSSFLPMPAAAAFSGGSSVIAAAASRSQKPITRFSSRFAFSSSSSCCICQCSAEKRAPFRAWVVLKDGLVGLRPSWLHTVSDGSSSFSVSAVECAKSTDEGLDCSAGGGGGEDGGDKEPGLEEKQPLRLNRRQRGSSSTVGGALAGNPDLLTIPGVGPRNLRKLVEKGIAGVAELKQLYKDKV